MGGTESHSILSPYDGLDIFVGLYLKEKPEAQTMDFGGHEHLLESLERWKRREETESTSRLDGTDMET
jgi:hypothetical protein